MSSSPSITIENATPDDLHALTILINDSYEVESGNTGVAFKKAKRIVSPETNLLPDIRAQRTLKAMMDKEIVGCVVWEIFNDDNNNTTSNNNPNSTTDSTVLSKDSTTDTNGNCSTALSSTTTPHPNPNNSSFSVRESTSYSSQRRLHFGPFAVNPKLQGKGIGKVLLNHLYTMAKDQNCASIDIEVVHLRTDILPMYAKLGYEKIGEAPFPVPELTTRDCHFILLRKML